MVPLEAALATTVHTAQGTTVEAHVMVPPVTDFAHGLLYVALSRCKTLAGLFLVKHRVTAKMFTNWRKEIDIVAEYNRLCALPH